MNNLPNIVKWLTGAIIATYPLANLGIHFGYFPISIPAFLLYLLSICLLGYLRSENFVTLLVFAACILYFLATSIYRWPLGWALNPVLAFSMISLGVIIYENKIGESFIIKSLIISVLLALFASLVQVVLYSSGLNFSNIFGDLVFNKALADQRFSGLRLKGLFIEPAHQGIFGATIVFITLNFLTGKKYKKKMILFFLSAGTFLSIASFSLSGFVLLFSVVLCYIVTNKGIFRKAFILGLLGSLVLAILSFSPVMQEIVIERFISASENVTTFDLRNHESSRLHSYLLFYEYTKDKGPMGFFFGEGYGNYEYWLINNFSGSFTSFAEGKVANMLVAIFIGAGILGVILFLFYIFCLLRIGIFQSIPIFWFLFTLFFVFGTLVEANLWATLITIKYLNLQNQTTRHKRV